MYDYENNNNTAGYSTYQTEATAAFREIDSKDISKDSGKKEKKKSGGFFRKVMLSVSLGLFFGLFAGIGFFAVKESYATVSGRLESVSDDTLLGTNVSTKESQSGIKVTDTENVTVVSSDVSQVVEEVMPAMVSIVNNFTQTGTTMFGQSYSQEAASSGSGIIVAESDTELLIATNYHVVEGATKLELTFIDDSKAEAQIKGMDADMDLAVIAVPLSSLTEETKAAIAIAALGDSDTLQLGEPVIAIGNALGYGQSTTDGIVSALNREVTLEDGSTGIFIQTNAAINPGNSGGALLNIKGEVIGINSNKIGGSVVEGMGYAIPISAAKPIIDDLMNKETREKVEDGESGYLGVTLQAITQEAIYMYNMPQGIYVYSVEEGSAAAEGGMMKGDIITRFEGEKITSYQDLQDVLQYYSAGSEVDVTVMRYQNGEYESVELTLTLGSRPDNQ